MDARFRSDINVTPMVDPSLPFHRATQVLDLVKGVRPEARLSVVAARKGGWPRANLKLWIRAPLSARTEESPGSAGCWAW